MMINASYKHVCNLRKSSCPLRCDTEYHREIFRCAPNLEQYWFYKNVPGSLDGLWGQFRLFYVNCSVIIWIIRVFLRNEGDKLSPTRNCNCIIHVNCHWSLTWIIQMQFPVPRTNISCMVVMHLFLDSAPDSVKYLFIIYFFNFLI